MFALCFALALISLPAAAAEDPTCTICEAAVTASYLDTIGATNTTLSIIVSVDSDGTCAYDNNSSGCAETDPCSISYVTYINIGMSGGALTHDLDVYSPPLPNPRSVTHTQDPVLPGGPSPGLVRSVYQVACGDYFFYSVTLVTNPFGAIPAGILSGTVGGSCSDCTVVPE